MTDESVRNLSCGAVIVRQTTAGWVTLLLRAYSNWDFPKGMCEDGEVPLETAVREVGEETGLDDLQFNWGERYKETGPYHRGKVARYYLVLTAQEAIEMGVSPELGRPEHSEYRWVSFDAAYDLSAPRVREVVQWARQIVGA